MNFSVDLHLTALRCVQPDESEEEPYLWTFFFLLDGSTVKQLRPNDLQFVGSIRIASGYGGHANLSSATAVSGQTLQIPDNVGAYQATLRPIRLQILGQTIVIPGRLLAFCILMEEDATSGESMLKANAALRDFLELQWNDFINNQLNQDNITAEFGNVQQVNPGLTGRPLIVAAVQSLIDKFVDSLEDPAADVVEQAVIDDSDIFDLFDNFFDSDNSMGTQKLVFDEQQLINAGFEIPFHIPIIRTEDGSWTAYHELYGNIHATLTAGSNDFIEQTAQGATARLAGGEYNFDRAFLCIEPGTRVDWTLNGTNWEEDIRSTYPFLDVRWSVNDIVLVGPSGTIELSVNSGFPTFDPSQPPRLLTTRHTQRQVKVRYEIQNQGDEGRLLKLWNDPQDGNYSFIARAVGLAGKGVEIQLGTSMVTFTGQKIEIGPPEFLADFNECLDQINSIGEDYAKSKKVTLKDLWDPHSRFEAHEEMIQILDSLAVVRGLNESQITNLKEGIAKKLQVNLKQ
jgi:hypothetical protein